MNDKFNQSYYQFNRQNADRIGNLFYSNIIKKNFKFKSYLDFGCGVGFLLKRIEQVKGVKNIFGIETNEFAIKESEKNTKLSKIYKNIDEIHEKLDLVSMLHVVEHIDDDDILILLKKIKSKLTKNARLLISTPAKNCLAHTLKNNNWIGFKDPTHINLKKYDEWIDLFKKMNLIVLNTYSDGLWDFPYGRFINNFRYLKIYFLMFIQIFFGVLLLKYDEGETFIFILKNDD